MSCGLQSTCPFQSEHAACVGFMCMGDYLIKRAHHCCHNEGDPDSSVHLNRALPPPSVPRLQNVFTIWKETALLYEI